MTQAWTLLTDISDQGIATLVMNRPEIHNAFDDDLIRDMTVALRELDEDFAVRVIVLAANGKSFSAGADMNWMKRVAEYTEKENLEDARHLADLMRTLNELKKPTIAKVQGPAFGGGVGLVACCDIALASEHAAFALTEVKLGLIPSVISPYVVRAISERQARRYFLTAERFDAREALRIGLVHKVVSTEQLDDWTLKFARQLLANGPEAMNACKELIRDVSHEPIDDKLIEDTAQRIATIRISDEGQEGLDAFLSKRKPDWYES